MYGLGKGQGMAGKGNSCNVEIESTRKTKSSHVKTVLWKSAISSWKYFNLDFYSIYFLLGGIFKKSHCFVKNVCSIEHHSTHLIVDVRCSKANNNVHIRAKSVSTSIQCILDVIQSLLRFV